jgi:hypothetical protein
MSLDTQEKLWIQDFGDNRWQRIVSSSVNTDVSMDFGTITTPSSAIDVDFGSIT